MRFDRSLSKGIPVAGDRSERSCTAPQANRRVGLGRLQCRKLKHAPRCAPGRLGGVVSLRIGLFLDIGSARRRRASRCRRGLFAPARLHRQRPLSAIKAVLSAGCAGNADAPRNRNGRQPCGIPSGTLDVLAAACRGLRYSICRCASRFAPSGMSGPVRHPASKRLLAAPVPVGGSIC